jgi:hypothetical protein
MQQIIKRKTAHELLGTANYAAVASAEGLLWFATTEYLTGESAFEMIMIKNILPTR